MNSPNYTTCACQNCNGHIKFDANDLKKGETRRIECPHCHLETVIFNKPEEKNTTPSADINKTSPQRKANSSKIELFFFELTRFPTVTGAFIVLAALAVSVILLIQTRLPDRPVKAPIISYDMVAPVPATLPETPKSEGSPLLQGAKMANKNAFPQPVIDFLLTHQGFALKEWLSQMNPTQKQAYLKNLADVLVAAKSKNTSTGEIEQVVKDFSELWLNNWNEAVAAQAKESLVKGQEFTQLTTVAFGLVISFMILCLILVMLAIERNTRSKGANT